MFMHDSVTRTFGTHVGRTRRACSVRSARRALAGGVLALATVGTLAACGDDSSTAQDATTAAVSPSVVVPANPTSTDGEVATTTPNPHSGGGAVTGPGAGAGSADGGVTEITELPPAASVRTETDDKFLDTIKGDGLDVTDQVTQDQIIAAGHEQCQANEEGRDSFSVPAVAGQLRELGITDRDPEDTARIIREAAEANYCR